MKTAIRIGISRTLAVLLASVLLGLATDWLRENRVVFASSAMPVFESITP